MATVASEQWDARLNAALAGGPFALLEALRAVRQAAQETPEGRAWLEEHAPVMMALLGEMDLPGELVGSLVAPGILRALGGEV